MWTALFGKWNTEFRRYSSQNRHCFFHGRQSQRRFIDAAGEAREDWRIISDVAQKMNFTGFNYKSSGEDFAEHVALTKVLKLEQRHFNLSDWTFETAAQYEALEPSQWGGPQPFSDGRFETPNGKAKFVATKFQSRHGDANSLTLNTGRIRDQWHTMTRTGLVPKLFQHRAEPYIEISPEDAIRLFLKPADLAMVSGSHGQSLARVVISDSIAPGQVFQPMHWNARFASAAVVNATSTSVVDSVIGQPALKSARINLKRFDAAWYGFGIVRGSTSLTFDYWSKSPLKGGTSFERAGLKRPVDWPDLLAGLFETSQDQIAVTSSPSHFRCADVFEGRLQLAFFASESPVEVSRAWLQQLFTTQTNAMEVLASRPVSGVADCGPIVCSCNGIGRRVIADFIAHHGAASLNQICAGTNAGTGCGSCRPEIQRIKNSTTSYAIAAE